MVADGWSSVPNWVVRSDVLDSAEKLIYISLLNRANSRGESWPSAATLASDAGVSVRTVWARLASLTEKGLISRVHRAGATGAQVSNLYRILAWEPSSGHSKPLCSGCTPPCSECSPPVQDVQGAYAPVADEVLPNEVLPNEVLPPISPDDEFERAWGFWPKKVEKKAALAKFKRACKQHPPEWLAEQIIRFGQAYAATRERQYIPGLAPWLNGERWNDELPTGHQQSPRTARVDQNLAEYERLYGGSNSSDRAGSVPALDARISP